MQLQPPKLWNKLPLYIKLASTLPVFKSCRKTHFYSLAFDSVWRSSFLLPTVLCFIVLFFMCYLWPTIVVLNVLYKWSCSVNITLTTQLYIWYKCYLSSNITTCNIHSSTHNYQPAPCTAVCYLVELLIIGHRQLDVPGSYSAFLVVPCCVSCQLQDLSWEERKHRQCVLRFKLLWTPGPSGTRILEHRPKCSMRRKVNCCSIDVDKDKSNEQEIKSLLFLSLFCSLLLFHWL